MELIDKNEINFKPIRIFNMDEHEHEVTGMALFKDIEKIPTVKAIPIEELEKAIEAMENVTTSFGIYIDRADALEILYKIIESEEK